VNGKRAKRLRKRALRLCRAVEEPHALYHMGEVIGSDGRRRRMIRAMQSMYRPGSFDRVYREMKKMGSNYERNA